MISAVAAIIKAAADLRKVAVVLKEETAGRTLDSKSLKSRVRVSFRKLPLRIWKSPEPTKSAEAIRNVTRSQEKTSSTRKRMAH
ncbi:MAG: hypothetical protein E7Z79_03335 [Methanobrevibacter thaueri]|uniref:Uncharacterized protein n=2 Tax=Methanobrevibacter thaueri TaxID=190975 RepID=A0A8T3V770_9EURY|nr:hypothetical protein [Methanobrevibacter thaueri]